MFLQGAIVSDSVASLTTFLFGPKWLFSGGDSQLYGVDFSLWEKSGFSQWEKIVEALWEG